MFVKRIDDATIQARRDAAKERILAHYRETGRRPTPSTSQEWRHLNWILEHHGCSLAKISDSLGIPAIHKTRSFESIEAEILAFVAENGRHPIATRDKQFMPHDKWLRRRGTSLSWVCYRLGYAPSVGGERTTKAEQ